MDRFVKKERWELKDNIYISYDNNVKTAFSSDMQSELYEIEDNSWWFKYRAEVIINLLKLYFNKDKLTLDIGGGNGYTTVATKKCGYSVALMEPTYEACVNAKMRGIDEVYCGSMNNDNINDSSIEQVLLLDVLEHIEDDSSFLELIHRKMTFGGKCLITVPACQSLWSSEDDITGHYRRYSLKSICHLVTQNGFELVYSNYFMMFLYIPIYIIRVWFERLGIIPKNGYRTEEEQEKILKQQFETKRGLVDKILNSIEKIELILINSGRRILFGSSIVLVISKPHRNKG